MEYSCQGLWRFVKYITPYAYADGANVIPAGELEPEPVFLA